MDPVKNSWCNETYAVGESSADFDLPCRRDKPGLILSWWKPTKEELALLVKGGSIQLGIHTEPIPPVSLGVVFTADDYEALERDEWNRRMDVHAEFRRRSAWWLLHYLRVTSSSAKADAPSSPSPPASTPQP